MNALTVSAGDAARSIVKDQGLRPEMVKVMAGAAGGPKWLVLSHLDRLIFSSWLVSRNEPLFLVGSSIGAWRFAAAAQRDPAGAIDRFESVYINQRYSGKPTPAEISAEATRIQSVFLPEAARREIVGHPYFRLNVMAVRCKWPANSAKKGLQGLGFIMAALLNAINRNWLKVFFERVLFFDPRDVPPFFDMNQFPIHHVPLTEENVSPALLASGSIPLVMTSVRDIPGAPPGSFRDGGVLDYHLDIPFLNEDGIVLFPHFLDRIVPGWLDKKLPSRRPDPAHMSRVVLVSPSEEFVDSLPFHKIPDRDDFLVFKGRDDERIAYWQAVVEAGRRLRDEFLEAVETDKIREMVKPLT